MSEVAGRSCPLAYRYGATALAAASTTSTETLYVVGGLYGNTFALDAVEAMATQEATGPIICFNGDFNWFNVDAPAFLSINRRVLAHRAIAGNVEFELCTALADAGCGCAYPESVDQALVERSNRIHSRLKQTAHQFPNVLENLSSLPLFARFSVGTAQVGVVHGDANSLAGWLFDVVELDKMVNRKTIIQAFIDARVNVFASTHTCLPATRSFQLSDGIGVIANNGAAGMPNFQGQQFGLLTRISVYPSPHVSMYGLRQDDVHIDTLPIFYNDVSWREAFLLNWPEGSDAHTSYWDRIENGPKHKVTQGYAL